MIVKYRKLRFGGYYVVVRRSDNKVVSMHKTRAQARAAAKSQQNL